MSDHLGNVRAVVNLVLEQNDYRPFGERVDDERMEVDGENRYRFVNNLGTYSLASDLFYLNGGPSDGAIEIITGNSRRGMMKMWRDALRDPVYYLYAASALGTAFLIAPNYNKIYFGQNPNQTYR